MTDLQHNPPQSIDTEKAIIGAILKTQDTITEVVRIIDEPSAFYVPKHRLIYKTCLDLFQKGQPCDITLVAEALGENLQQTGGRGYLVELIENVVTTANVVAHCEIVMGKAQLRRLINVCQNVVADCYAQDRPVVNVINDCEEAVFAVCEQRQKSGPQHISQILPDVLSQIATIQQGKPIEGQVDTGFGKLDWLLKGAIRPGKSVIIAGRPSHGKSQLVLQMAENASIGQGKTVLLFSLEMVNFDIGVRFLADQSRVDSAKMRTAGGISSDEWQTITRAQARLSNADIFVDDRSILSPLEILATARSHSTKHDLGLVIVDYLQLVRPGKEEARHLEVAAISRYMKIISKELNVPVITLSALNRDDETKKPSLSRLRDSSALEYDADVVLFVWHSASQAFVIVGKNKEGLRGEVEMLFHEGRWDEIDNKHEPVML